MDTSLLVLGLYAGLAGLYLLVIPYLVMLMIDRRWNVSSGWEKILIFFLTFFFFPGMILVGPLLNFRPQERSL